MSDWGDDLCPMCGRDVPAVKSLRAQLAVAQAEVERLQAVKAFAAGVLEANRNLQAAFERLDSGDVVEQARAQLAAAQAEVERWKDVAVKAANEALANGPRFAAAQAEAGEGSLAIDRANVALDLALFGTGAETDSQREDPLPERIARLKSQRDQARAQLAAARDDLATSEAQKAALRDTEEKLREAWSAEVLQLEDRIAAEMAESNRYAAQLSVCQGDLDQARADLAAARAEIATLVENTGRYNAATREATGHVEALVAAVRDDQWPVAHAAMNWLAAQDQPAPAPCSRCNGLGTLRAVSDDESHTFSVPCPDCQPAPAPQADPWALLEGCLGAWDSDAPGWMAAHAGAIKAARAALAARKGGV